jgi:hypothetical protein
MWFINNARGILIDIVKEKSDGQVKLELSKARFNFFSNQLQIHEGELTTADTLTPETSYRVKFSALTLKVRSFWPLLLKKDLYLDSININNPVIEVVQWKKDTLQKSKSDDISITEEMGIIYNSTIDVLQDFGIRRILVNNASFKLSNKTKPGSFPVWITNINLSVLRDPDNFTNTAQRSVRLQTVNQSIGFPSGRHRLSFKKFDLQLLQNRIELDSCTITAIAKGKSTSSYIIFFKKLMLVGVDFAAMSNLNLVKADSVYCINPLFNITLNPLSDPSEEKQKTDPEKIIKELTSDLDLAFVGVKDAGIELNILGSRPRKIINSNKDNFEIRGLHIKSDSTIPVSVNRFDMVVRDYHLYNVDSSAIFGFDSIHFNNQKITLNNFSVTTTPSPLKVRSLRNFRFPRFELTGLDWYSLIFDQNVVAREAVLTNPVINYTRRTPATNKKVNFFETLQNLDSLMTLDQLSIENGNLNLNFGKATQLQLEKVNVKVLSNRLMRATNRESLRKAVDYFSLTKGVLRRNDLTAQLQNIKYDPNNTIYADKLLMTSTTGKVSAEVNKVIISNMLLDERTEIIEADAIQWKDANVRLLTAKTGNEKKVKSMAGSLNIKNIQGVKTILQLDNGITRIDGSVSNLVLKLLEKTDNGPLRIEGLQFGQSNILLSNDLSNISATTNGLEVDKMILMNEASDIVADGVRWASADVRIAVVKTSTQLKENSGSLSINNLAAKNTLVEVGNNDGLLKSTIDVLQAEEFMKLGNAPFTSNGLLVSGTNLLFTNSTVNTSAAAFRIAQNDRSFVHQFDFANTVQNDSTSITASVLNFKIDVNELLAGRYQFKKLEVEEPQVAIIKQKNDRKKDSAISNSLALTIDELVLQRPGFRFNQEQGDKVFRMLLPVSDSGVITAKMIVVDSNGMSMDSIFLFNKGLSYTGTKGTAFKVADGNVRAALSNVLVYQWPAAGWNGVVDEITVEEPVLVLKGKNLPVKVAALSVGGVNLSNTPPENEDYFGTSKNAWLRTTEVVYTDSKSTMQWQGALYSNIDKTLVVDSFRYAPNLSRSAFMAQLPFEKDYMTINTGTMVFKGLDMQRFENDSAIIVETANIERPQINIYRDKRLPDAPKTRKYFPGSMVSKLAKEVSIPVINISNGAVSYTEKHDKTGEEGTLQLDNLNGTIKNIRNRGFAKKDSLRIDLHAILMNAAPLHLQIKESYLDTASGFDMQLAIEPFAMPALNPVMTPLAGINIQRGHVDSLRVHATANEEFAVGKIDMHYRDLGIRLTSGTSTGRGNIKQRIMTFIANTFVIKNNNNKTGIIFHVRKKDKSFFSYLLKIAMDGIGSSVGAANNYNKIRQIEKAEAGGQLPAYAPVFTIPPQ